MKGCARDTDGDGNCPRHPDGCREQALFNEDRLRADIAATWGEHGAHIDLFDMILARARQAQDHCICFAPAKVHDGPCHPAYLTTSWSDA